MPPRCRRGQSSRPRTTTRTSRSSGRFRRRRQHVHADALHDRAVHQESSMRSRLANLAAAAALALSGPALAQSPAAPQTDPHESQDPFLWLEELNGARAMDWVRAENARTLKVLEADP